MKPLKKLLKLDKLKMMKIEYYDSIPQEKLDHCRAIMRERIFCKKRNDGQRDKKKYGEVVENLSQLEKDYKQKVNEILDNAERYNIHPNELFKLKDPEFIFYPFGELNITSEFKPLFKDEYENEEEFLTFLSGNHKSNEDECYEKSFLDKLIRKWFEGNGKDYPGDDSNIEFFYDYGLVCILDEYKKQKKNLSYNDNEFMRIYDYLIIKAKIYTYRNNIKSDIQNFNLLLKNFKAESELYQIQNIELLEESEYSDRGSIFIDNKNPAFIYKLNGQDIYQFTSIHFWEIYDEFILLQANQPDLFGKGAEPILRGLYKIFSGKNERYWGSFEEFKLKIQQQYLYTANEKQGLRLDLYRNIFDDGDFQGGVWHGFKHFKSNGKTLSAKSEGGKNYSETHFFNMLLEAFFVQKWVKFDKDTWSSSIPYSPTEGEYIFGFYKYKCPNHDNSTLYSLSTTKYES